KVTLPGLSIELQHRIGRPGVHQPVVILQREATEQRLVSTTTRVGGLLRRLVVALVVGLVAGLLRILFACLLARICIYLVPFGPYYFYQHRPCNSYHLPP